MNIKSKKAYVLVMVMIFIIIIITVGIGLYYSVGHVAVETKVQEEGYVRGYYVAIAGLRWAAILLRDPAGNLEFTDPGTIEAEFDTGDLSSGDLLYDPFNNFCTNININPADLTITITEQDAAGTNYDLSATYRY